MHGNGSCFLLHTRHNMRMGNMVVLHRLTNEKSVLVIIAKICLALEDRRNIIPLCHLIYTQKRHLQSNSITKKKHLRTNSFIILSCVRRSNSIVQSPTKIFHEKLDI